MKEIQIKDIVTAVSGTMLWGDEEQFVTEVVTDSRQAKAGSLFVPIIGERVDAHKFIPDVIRQGASCVFSSRDSVVGEQGACILVQDTLQALQDFAAWYRNLFTLPVIGITGSVGKTTTKEMIASVFETKYKTLKTYKNLNSQIGVALMMFQIEEDTEVAVIEMGISMPGEMDRLVNIAKPVCATITNIGVSHIGNLGSREKICAEKGKIITNFPENGTLYVCGNGDLQALSRENIPYDKCLGRCEIIYYGTEEGCLFFGDDIRLEEDGQSFLFHYPGGEYRVSLSIMGMHNINNAIVALALAVRYHIPLEQAGKALKEYCPIDMRGVVHHVRNVHIVDDTYNASPDSINSNLSALFDYPGDGRRIAVLADVLELGERSRELHEGIGKYIHELAEKGKKLDILLVVGQEAKAIAEYVSQHTPIETLYCKDKEEIVKEIQDRIQPGDWILVKGSRGMHMDEVVEQLIKE